MFAGEIRVVDFFQASVLDVSIDLGGGNTGVAEHSLYGSQIRAVIQEVSGERMAKHMRGYRLDDARSNGTAL